MLRPNNGLCLKNYLHEGSNDRAKPGPKVKPAPNETTVGYNRQQFGLEVEQATIY